MRKELTWSYYTADNGDRCCEASLGGVDYGGVKMTVWPHGGRWWWHVPHSTASGTEDSEAAAKRAAVQATCRLLRAWLGRGELALEVM